MKMVKIWNDNIYPYQEEFKDDLIKIPAGKYVEMERTDAKEFLGQFTAPILDGNDQHDPRGFKKLRIEEGTKKIGLPENPKRWLCQACGFEARSEWELDGHVNALHLDSMTDVKEREKRQEVSDKRGPGRPPKGS